VQEHFHRFSKRGLEGHPAKRRIVPFDIPAAPLRTDVSGHAVVARR